MNASRSSERESVAQQHLASLLNEYDVARITGLSVASVRRWRLFGEGPRFLKIGASVRYSPEDLETWLKSRPTGGASNMRTPKSFLPIADFKDRLPNVSQIARELFSIEFRGTVAQCPLATNHNHGDRDPSLRFDKKKNRIFCASQQCFGENGVDAFGLVQTMENCSFHEACTKLSDHYGLTIPDTSRRRASSPVGKICRATPKSRSLSLAQQNRDELRSRGFEARAEYFYSPLLRKVRFEHASELQPGKQKPKKDFRWEHCVDGVWYSGDGGMSKQLYVNRVFREVEQPEVVVGFEGEGKADAAAELSIAGFSYKDITNEQAATLVGRTVVLWPDNDASGRRQGAAAAKAIAACGKVRELKQLTPPSEFPDAADIVDAITSLAWNRERILEFIDTARAVDASSVDRAKIPERIFGETGDPHAGEFPFRTSTEGVFFLKACEDGSNSPIWLAAPIHVVAQTRDANGSNWGRLLQWKDNEGRDHGWVMPMELLAADASAVRAKLLSDGLPSITTNARHRERLNEYLQTVQVERCLRTVSRIGWQGDAYVLPDQVFAPKDSEEILYRAIDDGMDGWGVQGTLSDWRERIGGVCSGNSRLILAVSSAFAGPILGPTKSESGGVHFFGPSSTGKTTALLVGASVCGGGSNGRVRTWRTTTNGLEAVASGHNDSTLFIDEISQIDPVQAAETAYLLANGNGKQRMTKSLSSQSRLSWKLLFVSAGEITFAEHAASGGRPAKAGVEVRLLNVPADAGRGWGVFENLHGAPSAQAFVQVLRDASSQLYGTPIRTFLSRLVADRAVAQASLAAAKKEVNEVLPHDAGGQVQRAAERFGLIAAAGELATSWGITGWRKGEAIWAAQQCLLAWIQSRGTSGNSDAENGVRRVRAFLESYGESRFQWIRPSQSQSPAASEPAIQDRAGFRRVVPNKNTTEYLIFRETFRSQICTGLDSLMVAKELDKRGFLWRESKDYTIKPRLPGLGSPRVFCVLASILESEEC